MHKWDGTNYNKTKGQIASRKQGIKKTVKTMPFLENGDNATVTL